MRPDPAAVADAIREQVEARGPAKSVCPSEVARRLAEDWRPLMPAVRAAAAQLADAGEIVILKRGAEIAPDAMRGPIRLALPRRPSARGAPMSERDGDAGSEP